MLNAEDAERLSGLRKNFRGNIRHSLPTRSEVMKIRPAVSGPITR